MVYIHGGNFVKGASNLFPGHILATFYKVVVVTINYRLGALGKKNHYTKPPLLTLPCRRLFEHGRHKFPRQLRHIRPGHGIEMDIRKRGKLQRKQRRHHPLRAGSGRRLRRFADGVPGHATHRLESDSAGKLPSTKFSKRL